MATITCSCCYTSSDYKYNKPDFCFKCGKSYVAGFAAPSSKLKPRRRQVIEAEEEYEEVDTNRWKNLDLKVETGFERERGIKVRDLSTGAGGAAERMPETRTAQEVMAEFKRKSSTSGKPTDID